MINSQVVSGTSGTFIVSPVATTPYTLVVNNSTGSDTRSLVVTVTGLPTDCNVAFTATPQTQTLNAAYGGSVAYSLAAGASTKPCLFQVHLPTIKVNGGNVIWPFGGSSDLPLNAGSTTVAIFEVGQPTPAGSYALPLVIYGGVPYVQTLTVYVTVAP